MAKAPWPAASRQSVKPGAPIRPCAKLKVLLRAYQYPDRFRVEIKYPGTEELRILRGKQVWKASQPMAGPFYGATLLQAARISLPWNLLKNRADVKDLGPVKTDDGRSLQALELALGEGLSVRVGIDTESGRILQSSGRMSGTMGIMEFGTSYEDFRQQNGILYAAMEKHSAMGNPTGYTHIDKIEFVDSLPDELFLPVDDTNRI